MFTIEVEGQGALADALERLPAAVQAVLASRAHALSDRLQAQVRGKLSGGVLHSRTGALLRSIVGRVRETGSGVSIEVGSEGDLKYAAIQEFGGVIPPHDILPDKAKALAFLAGGGAVFPKVVHHPGSVIPERSYLRSSLADMAGEIEGELKDAVLSAVRSQLPAPVARGAFVVSGVRLEPGEPSPGVAMIEQTVEIETPSGAATTFVVHPERGGPHPAIIFYMDAPGIREELRDMSRRLATAGYYVVLPNLYYRAGVMELGPLPGPTDTDRRQRMMDLMAGLTIPMIMDDTKALLAFIDSQPAAAKGDMGCVGYCMSGQFATNAAATFPDRFAAAASIYGTFLVTDEDNSPHRVARQARAELYFACAETDRWAPPETVTALAEALQADKVDAEVELYPGVEHGFAFPQRPAYDKPSAERHWERLLTLFKRRLG